MFIYKSGPEYVKKHIISVLNQTVGFRAMTTDKNNI